MVIALSLLCILGHVFFVGRASSDHYTSVLLMQEIAAVVPEDDYGTLVARIQTAEEAHGQDEADADMLAAGLQIRLCPKCNTRIEKNEGCVSLVTTLCHAEL